MDRSFLLPGSRQSVNFQFPEHIDRYWLGSGAFRTHLLNSATLLLPDVERYLIRTIKQAAPLIEQPLLQQQLQAFIGQEAQHATQHRKFWHNLCQQGYRIDRYLRWLRRILFAGLERHAGFRLNLAISAGLEHLTTLMAVVALEQKVLATAEPQMRELFEWHAAEEIEHRAVVYDVLQAVTANYALRLIGLVISHILVLGMLNLGLLLLLWRDRKLIDPTVWRDAIQFWLLKERFLLRTLQHAFSYCKPSFNPAHQSYTL